MPQLQPAEPWFDNFFGKQASRLKQIIDSVLPITRQAETYQLLHDAIEAKGLLDNNPPTP